MSKLNKKQQELFDKLSERKDIVESNFNKELQWKEICEIIGIEYATGNTKKSQLNSLKLFINFTDNGKQRNEKRYILESWTELCISLCTKLTKLCPNIKNLKNSTNTLGEKTPKNVQTETPTKDDYFKIMQDTNLPLETRVDASLNFAFNKAMELPSRVEEVEQIDKGLAELKNLEDWRLKKMVAKSIVEQLLFECSKKDDISTMWFATEPDLLKATGLISISNYNAIVNKERFLCSLDLKALEEGEIIFKDTLPDSLQNKLERDKIEEDTPQYKAVLCQYIKDYELEDIRDIVFDTLDTERDWVSRYLKGALSYIKNQLRLVAVYEAHKLYMNTSRQQGDITVTTSEPYYPTTLEEWRFIEAQYSTVMRDMGYNNWNKLVKDDKIKLFYIKLCKQLNENAPSYFGWGKINRVYRCTVLSFDKEEVARVSNTFMKLSDEERATLKSISNFYANTIRNEIYAKRLEANEKRIAQAEQGKSKKKTEEGKQQQIQLRLGTEYRPFSRATIKELYSSETTYRWFKKRKPREATITRTYKRK